MCTRLVSTETPNKKSGGKRSRCLGALLLPETSTRDLQHLIDRSEREMCGILNRYPNLSLQCSTTFKASETILIKLLVNSLASHIALLASFSRLASLSRLARGKSSLCTNRNVLSLFFFRFLLVFLFLFCFSSRVCISSR